MPNPKARAAALMASPDDAEREFYEALREADLDRLMAVWADDDEIVCVHPGGGRLVGALPVRASFESIFSNGPILAQPEHVKRVEAMGCAMHNVLERIDVTTSEGPRTGWVLATNVYLKTAEGWRLVAHHASPGSLDESVEVEDPPAVLH